MNKCKKNILLVFGYLLFVAILFVPYSSSFVEVEMTYKKSDLKPDSPPPLPMFVPVEPFDPLHYVKKTEKLKSEKHGWVFSPYALISTLINKKHFVINRNALETEIALILLTAGFAYILFCIVLKKRGLERYERNRQKGR